MNEAKKYRCLCYIFKIYFESFYNILKTDVTRLKDCKNDIYPQILI